MKVRLRRAPRRRQFPLVTAVARLRLEPGDVLLLHIPEASMPAPEVHAMVFHLKTVMGRPNLPVVVLPPGVRFGVANLPEGS